MNIFVLVKQVPDTETKIRVTSDGKGIETGDIKWIVNPYDEFAIEEALKTKEKQTGTVTVVAAGPDRVVEALRTAVAMGADNAIHLKTEGNVDSFVVAKALATLLAKENAEVVFSGKQAIDDDQGAVPAMVGELWNVPSVSVVTKIDWAADKKSATVERDVESGTKHVVSVSLPVVLALDKGINTPRYASLPGIMKAKKKEIKAVTLADLGLGSLAATTEDGGYKLPPDRPPGKKLTGDAAAQAKELVRLLREEAKVL